MKIDFTKLRDDAAKGKVKAMRILGFHYLEESANKKHYSSAVEWLRKAALKDDKEAQYILGFMYLNGVGRNKCKKIAKEWLDKAALNGQTNAPDFLMHLFDDKSGLRFPVLEEAVANDDEDTKADETSDDNNKQPTTFSDLGFGQDENGKIKINNIDDLKRYEPKPNPEQTEDSDEEGTDDPDNDDKKSYTIDDVYEEYTLEDDKPNRSYNSFRSGGYDEHLYDSQNWTVHNIDSKIDPLKKLDSLIGLETVKTNIDSIQKYVQFELLRQQAHLPYNARSNHFVFSGNPGTGKTTVARLLGHIFYNLNILEKGHTVEVDRSDLVGAYVGHSALKTKAAIKKARGGILFIDEAHALEHGSSWDFGDEVISTLVKAMEDERSDFIVVMAGYKDEMEIAIRSNPGLQSRVRHHIHFDDFGAQALLNIFIKLCEDEKYILSDDAKTRLQKILQQVTKENPKKYGNARLIRNLFEKTIERMAQRVIQNGATNDKDLTNILFSDFPSFEELMNKKKNKHLGTSDVVEF